MLLTRCASCHALPVCHHRRLLTRQHATQIAVLSVLCPGCLMRASRLWFASSELHVTPTMIQESISRNVAQVVSFIERAALWRTPPIFYSCVLELMHEPAKAAETARCLQEQLRDSSDTEMQPGDHVDGAVHGRNHACTPCTTAGTGNGACCGATTVEGTLLQRCIRSRAAASLLVCDFLLLVRQSES
jgi:hypothetical protein